MSDRIAQTVVRSYLEPEVEPLFHPDSYGYRPKRSALDAVAACRERCWRNDWVIDLDIRAFFDTLDHDLVMRSVAKHTNLSWVLLYVQRWLKAPLQTADGALVPRDRGTPQGSAISPLLANLFLHYAFDRWMAGVFPDVRFERYADDAVIHCKTKNQADHILGCLGERMTEVGLELHSGKTKIVYCKDSNRGGSYENERFTFLGYTFGPRLAANRHGRWFVSFVPAVANDALKAFRSKVRRWRLHLWVTAELNEIAEFINQIVRGWIGYYGRFYRSQLLPTLRHINNYLIRWAQQKYKRLKGRTTRTRDWLTRIAERDPGLFVHWQFGATP